MQKFLGDNGRFCPADYYLQNPGQRINAEFGRVSIRVDGHNNVELAKKTQAVADYLKRLHLIDGPVFTKESESVIARFEIQRPKERHDFLHELLSNPPAFLQS